MKSAVEDFERSLRDIRFFVNVGAPHPVARRIESFDDWPGPEDGRVEQIHLRQQAIHDDVIGSDPSEVQEIFDRVVRSVVIIGSNILNVPEETDAWDPRGTAVWHAAWTAGLVAVHLALQRPLPSDLAGQWAWFQQGRWPAVLVSIDTTEFVIL